MSLYIEEWPGNVVDDLEPYLIDSMIIHREASGCVIIPSPDPEAHVRFGGSTGSRHYAVGRKSDATDFFGSNSQVARMWQATAASRFFGGVGIYFDTHYKGGKRVMYHVDQRKDQVWWLCPDQEDREYIYYHKDPVRFMRVLAEQLERVASW